ncbi:riboflavin synthase [Aneurinibacillus terranovensis]|uniref:riboflavin synthase n=1 Tax=Aneurinibacillus terranovensis TaxID=278991 RepID=UPI0004208CF4|nr:riboflavin synthase [Aneurinibacillus terranovensis]
MFTGIIEEIGYVRRITRGDKWCVLEISAAKVLRGVKLGDSIAVNGTCLTVTQYSDHHFSVDVMPETLDKTSLSLLSPGSPVNLERALAAGDRFGGHFVSGHIDGTGTITAKKPYGNAVLFEIEAPEEVLRYILPKGSIAVDGISLTVVSTTDSHFTVSIIPHTVKETLLQYKNQGDIVNLECDMIGKYIERFVSAREHEKRKAPITIDFLSEHGFA